MPSSNTAKSEGLKPEMYFCAPSVTTTLRATRSTVLRKVAAGEGVGCDGAGNVDGAAAVLVAPLLVRAVSVCCARAPAVATTRTHGRSNSERFTPNLLTGN